ncbi:hypothetical protein QFC22_004756 [Naganishia vaughanmartiniae]|uniref:Uncharacterized protein n=1 Tax=Naganishia vaughanmartiniae TaxID=1424756 RepID=A0ACC2WY16_9TREE|nr:hypothetical protein QFC22_004756 [Naganishia vaughanmartiniae]
MSTSNSISKPCSAQPKRLIICCDGTWQNATALPTQKSAGGAPSNVAKLSRLLAGAGTPNDKSGDDAGTEYQQVVYYDAGVGSDNVGMWDKLVQGGSGLGLLEKVIEAYNFLVLNYTPGDKLFFFGFSRGAFTARSCAGLVWEIGILRPSCISEFLRLYSAYVDSDKFSTPFAMTKEWKQFVESKKGKHVVPGYGSYKVPVDVIGVWDTVGALGVPDVGHFLKIDNSNLRKQYKFHDVELNPGVKHAFQALALDDQRAPFHPSVWKASSTKNPTLDLQQTWFAGVHMNVGGGSDTAYSGEADPSEQLASITYTWMLDRIRPHLAFDEEELQAQQRNWVAQLQPFTPAQIKAVDDARSVKEKVIHWWRGDKHAHGYAMPEIPDNFTEVYEFLGRPTDRIPLDLTKDDIAAGKYTNEKVHFSVDVRQKGLAREGGAEEQYVPQAMKGWKRRQSAAVAGGYEWYKLSAGKAGEREKVVPESPPEASGLPEGDSLEVWLWKKGLAQR